MSCALNKPCLQAGPMRSARQGQRSEKGRLHGGHQRERQHGG